MKQKRIISFILAMVMVFSIFTEAAVPVYAALEEESTVTAVVPTDDEL